MQAEPFEIAIPEEKLQDLRERLERINWAPDFGNDEWAYGVNGGYLRELAEHWLHKYDWRAHEAEMNRFANFRVEIEGMPIHFVHERGKGPNPIPIILSHGWPWTYWDLRHVIGPLTDPAAHGGDPADAFDVVVPSLPGYGFSTPLTTPGINYWRTADLWDTLMREVLGYERFAAQGGDWGALVTSQLGAQVRRPPDRHPPDRRDHAQHIHARPPLGAGRPGPRVDAAGRGADGDARADALLLGARGRAGARPADAGPSWRTTRRSGSVPGSSSGGATGATRTGTWSHASPRDDLLTTMML